MTLCTLLRERSACFCVHFPLGERARRDLCTHSSREGGARSEQRAKSKEQSADPATHLYLTLLIISGFWITIVPAEFWTLLRGGSRVLRRWLTPLGLPLGHMPRRLSPGARFGGLNRAPSRRG